MRPAAHEVVPSIHTCRSNALCCRVPGGDPNFLRLMLRDYNRAARDARLKNFIVASPARRVLDSKVLSHLSAASIITELFSSRSA